MGVRGWDLVIFFKFVTVTAEGKVRYWGIYTKYANTGYFGVMKSSSSLLSLYEGADKDP